jgi:hypothetical protein
MAVDNVFDAGGAERCGHGCRVGFAASCAKGRHAANFGESSYDGGMTELALALSLVLGGSALGWTAYFSFQAAPQAVRDLDAGRANRYIRNAMRGGHGVVAMICFLAGVSGLIGGAVAGAIVFALSGAFYLLARWTLSPREDARPAMGRRKLSTARIVAAGLTASLMILVLAGTVLVALQI